MQKAALEYHQSKLELAIVSRMGAEKELIKNVNGAMKEARPVMDTIKTFVGEAEDHVATLGG